MSSHAVKTSSRTTAAGAKFYDIFLETLMKISDEEDVCKLPEIVVVDKTGVQIADPETISRKLSEIAASLEREKAESALQDEAASAEEQVEQSAVEDKNAMKEVPKKPPDTPVETAIPQQDTGISQTADQISVRLPCSQAEICRRRKGQLKIISGRPETLTALAVRSTRIEEALLRSIGRCLLEFPTISQVRLENCRLKQEDVYLLAFILRDTDTLKELILDENPLLGNMCYSCIFYMGNNLQRLSLCGCELGDLGMVYLTEGLEHTGLTSPPLLRLNLISNRITCKGAQLLANALRTNRALLSVSLSGNQIRNTGAIALAEVFQRFQLRRQEYVERRARYFNQNLKKGPNSGSEDLYPFLNEVELENGEMYCKGNFKLLHLNLSYNSIGLPGLLAFQQAVLYQESALQPPDKGLLSISFQGNSFPEDRPELEEILRIFDARLELHRKSSKTSSLESSKSSSKTSGLNSSKTGLKPRELASKSDTASSKQ